MPTSSGIISLRVRCARLIQGDEVEMHLFVGSPSSRLPVLLYPRGVIFTQLLLLPKDPLSRISISIKVASPGDDLL